MKPPLRERGFLLIADMEGSTRSKFELDEVDAFNALRQHNELVMANCRTATPIPGLILNSLGDAVVAKFRVQGDPETALLSCLEAARRIVQSFEQLAPLRSKLGGVFHLRTKLLLQSYLAFRYGTGDDDGELAEELVGTDIDLAFRLAPIAWRLQVLVTESFMTDLLAYSSALEPIVGDAQSLLDRAHVARHSGASGAGPLRGINAAFRLAGLDYWVTDAREIARLKGIAKTSNVFALAFESSEDLIARGARQRITIKVRQDHHAVILASIALTQDLNDNYIGHVVEKLRDASDGNRLDSELTLCVAAKVYGEYDFFFRVSCIDDISLKRFFQAIRADSFGVSHIEVRSTLANRLAVTRHYPRIFERFTGRPYEIVLAWFERIAARDIYSELKLILEREDAGNGAVAILEVGEVIHHTPVYAIFVCESLRDYAQFFATHRLRPTGCRSHVGHIDRAADAQLRYSLMDGVYLPRRREYGK